MSRIIRGLQCVGPTYDTIANNAVIKFKYLFISVIVSLRI